MKQAVKVKDSQWGERLGNEFDGNKKLFCKVVIPVRKRVQERDEIVMNANGQILLMVLR